MQFLRHIMTLLNHMSNNLLSFQVSLRSCNLRYGRFLGYGLNIDNLFHKCMDHDVLWLFNKFGTLNRILDINIE